ncbi:hypothetical protein KK141_15820 [Dyella sp. LX-66]|uniref:hypothetical protein n=1 Tax=unclassified Dyella TaxID=2634549 RepID=UPI001BE0B202|nr:MULTISPECIES: hypothetical protein [unclassified Dyella]MBT2118109.1 hypothetical protein [Dyella sp. LX-1]MBT2141016.1 hypothetical protein [Dyella sp. LX-66]
MSDIGRVISRHRNNAALSIVVLVFASMLLACAALLFTIRGKAVADGAALINGSMIGCAVIGLALIGAAVLMRRTYWVLGEQGVQRRGGRGKESWRFEQIAETCQFYRAGLPVGLAWRREGDEHWGMVNAHLSGYRKFYDALERAYLHARLPKLLGELERGRVVEFKVLTQTGQWQRDFATGIRSYLRASTAKALRVSLTALTWQGREVAFGDIAEMDVTAWTSRLRLHLRDGTRVELSYQVLFDATLVMALIGALIPVRQARRAA